jgi:HEAT repeat protein
VWWREPLEILVGLLDEPSELLFELIDRDALVAAHCLQFAGQAVEQRVINAIIDALVEQMRYERAARREELIRLLSKTGYLPPQPLLWQLLYRERKSLVIVVLAQALADASLRRKQYNFSPIPETEAIKIDPELQGIINLWQEHILTDLPDVQAAIEAELIARLAAGGKLQERARGLAAIVLGHIGMDVARVPVREALLSELTRPRLNLFVAWCVTDALGQIKHEAVEQAAIRLYRAHQGRSSQVGQQRRVYAVYLLGAVGGRFEETAQLLYGALDDPNPKVRGYAVYAIGRLGLLEARERLEERLESRDPQKREQDVWALRRTVEAVGKVGTLESIHTLEPYLRHEQRRTRQRVREAIADIRRRYELI